MTDPESMELNEAVEHIMSVTGKSRKQARAALIEACRQGEIKTTGVDARTGERVDVPPEAFPMVN
jgi:hypothetical protein